MPATVIKAPTLRTEPQLTHEKCYKSLRQRPQRPYHPVMPVIKHIHHNRVVKPGELSPGDEVLSINGQPLRDVIDAIYHAADEDLDLTVRRPDGSLTEIRISKDPDADLGIEWEPDKIRICKANCDFCFVHQQPKKKMRRALYIKDDDYRLSFLHGNFVTLTNMTEEDYQRIFEQRLTPLYVSVHCTNDDVRRTYLRKLNAEPILPLLKRLHGNRIQTHTQIVVTPGLNDGEVLWQSFDDLLAMYPDVPSVGVVPIGLTRHRENLPSLELVSPELANQILTAIDNRQEAMRFAHGVGGIYAADDMFLIAGRSLPNADYYDDYCQVENGIGMLRQLLDGFDAREDDLPGSLDNPKRLCLITGTTAGPFISDLCERTTARVDGLELLPLIVENDFWGHTVTTANLLTGGDIATQFKQANIDADAVVLPPDCLNTDGFFLDDETPEGIAKDIGVPVLRSEYDFVETILQATR
jgi:putative radical SAM enzyme (TIGR03279 family)